MTNGAITVKQLAKACEELIRKGQGEKKILISADDEGNEYHELFYEFTKPELLFKDGMSRLPYGVDGEKAVEEYVVLG